MGHKKHPFDLVLTKAASAGSNDVEMDPVDSGLLYCIQRVICENETNGCSSVMLYKAGTGSLLKVGGEAEVQAGIPYWLSDDFYLHEGQYIVGRFAGCTASDLLRMVLLGWWTTLDRRGG